MEQCSLHKQIPLQIFNKFPEFYETGISLSCPQESCPEPDESSGQISFSLSPCTSTRPVVPRGLFPSGFRNKTL